jgi:putative intracellular protease/amidase
MKVYLVVVNTLADWEIGYLTAELNSRRFFRSPDLHCELLRVGADRSPVTTMGGMSITPDLALTDVRLAEGDLLVLPGGELWQEESSAALLRFAADALNAGHNVAAICGATEGLAQTGALNQRRHTSNDLSVLKQTCPVYAGAALYENKPAVRDGNLVTATGLAPLEFAYEVIKLLGVFSPAALEAWFKLHQTREASYYYALVDAMSALPEGSAA